MTAPNLTTCKDLVGDLVPHRDPNTIPLDIWRALLNADLTPTGYVKRERMRTLCEVYDDLLARIDILVCGSCGIETPRPAGIYGLDCPCGGRSEGFLDEYLSGPLDHQALQPVPHDWRWIACYATTGTNEGHYVHVEFVCLPDQRIPEGQPNRRVVHLALAKTFRGMAHAQEIATRCAKLLGA